MIDTKKYITIVGVLVGTLIVVTTIINIMLSNLTQVFSVIMNVIVILAIVTIIFSTMITNRVIKDKNVDSRIMNINFKIVSVLFPIITAIAKIMGISKNEIRKVYIKLNNKYIYSNSYNLKHEDILILTPHCIQNHNCKLKVTNEVENCKQCGKCNVGDLVRLKKDKNVKVFVATGGTLARKIIIDNNPKAVIAVACERDLTSGVQDINKIPVLGVFNKRPNGPCVDTSININEVKDAIEFFTSKNNK